MWAAKYIMCEQPNKYIMCEQPNKYIMCEQPNKYIMCEQPNTLCVSNQIHYVWATKYNSPPFDTLCGTNATVLYFTDWSND